MAIIDDYSAIAKRLRELNPAAVPKAHKSEPVDRWHNMAEDTARIYAQNRRTGPLADIILQRKREALKRR